MLRPRVPCECRLQFARDEIDRVFGEGYATAHPDVVAAVMLSASLDWAAQHLAEAVRDHVLRPGDRESDVELPNEDIEYFQRERRPDRYFPSGEPKPQHPIVIEGSILGGRYE